MFVKRKTAWGVPCAAVACLTAAASLAAVFPPEAEQERGRRMAWWREAKFGMFIHWGVYAVPAGTYKGGRVKGIGEWIMHRGKIPIPEYEKFAREFNPVKFNADEWARIAAGAGMKYMVITSKHHDGFCMWDSEATGYDIVDATPFTRDPLEELARACGKQGIRFCFYHSIMDWHHPDAKGPNFARYRDSYMKPQLRELLTGYGPIGILWFDGEWIGEWTEPQGKDLYAFCRGLQPGIIVNNRVGKGRRGMAGTSAEGAAGDYATPEQQIPGKALGVDWETCMTMNGTWGYKSYDHNWKSTTDLLRKLVDVASKGGNFLLNVGPTAEGLIPEPSIERLREMGRWLEVNGESIYGTKLSPFRRLGWGRCTVKPGKLFLHVFDWPGGGVLEVPGLRNRTKRAYLLAARRKRLNISRNEDGVSIRVPSRAPDPIDTVVVLEIEGEPEVEDVLFARQRADGSVHLYATEATIHGNTAKYESGAKNCIGFWMNKSDRVSWDLEIKTPGTFTVEVAQACERGAGGSEYVVGVAGSSVTGTVKDTGSWNSFVKEELGTVTVPAAGRHVLSVKPVRIARSALMNLRSVVLKPARQ